MVGKQLDIATPNITSGLMNPVIIAAGDGISTYEHDSNIEVFESSEYNFLHEAFLNKNLFGDFM